MKSKQNVRHYLFDVEMLRRRLLRPYFIELGLTVGQGQPRIVYELRKWGVIISVVDLIVRFGIEFIVK